MTDIIFCEADFETCLVCEDKTTCPQMHLKGRCLHEGFSLVHNSAGDLISVKCLTCETRFSPDGYREFKKEN